MTRSAKSEVLRRQRRWAETAGRVVDARGFVARLDDNLRLPAAAATLAAFDRPGSSELRPGQHRPPRLFALHSSAALVINVFEHWTSRDPAPLLNALALEGSATTIGFERPFETAVPGDPPYVDVTIELESGRVVAIESKFTEWLAPRPPNRGTFKSKYFAGGVEHWAASGLPRCQAFAADVQARRERFKHLHAAQILKQALALVRARRPVSLYYLYYDVECAESKVHRAEIERCRARLAPEIELGASSYQELFRRLDTDQRVDREYVGYLRSRYFPPPR